MKTKPLLIKNVNLKNNVLAAPLAGVSDVGFRSVCRIFGASLTYTEMISAKGLYYNNKNTERLLNISKYENPCAVQLFGSDADLMAEICCYSQIEKFDIIDINMGCPVPKVYNNKEGAALMNDIKKAEKIIKACEKATKKPITVKFRKGIDQNNINAVEFAKMCENSGASLITIHGRLKSQLYSGKSDKKIIADVVKAVKIPVIANGDVFCENDAQNLINETGASGIMVARGSLGYPQIFADITEQYKPLSQKEAILKHLNILNNFTGEKFTCLNMRKHLLWYLNKCKGGKAFKNKAGNVQSITEITNLINEVFTT